MTPVVLAGLGAVTGYGWGVDALADGLRSGTSAGAEQVIDGVTVIGAPIPPRSGLDDDGHPRFEQAACAAVTEALADAGRRGWREGARVGLVFCTGIGDIQSIRDNYFRDAQPRASLFPRLLHTSIGSVVGQAHGWTGPNVVVNAACSSGNAALQLAQSWIASGLATDVVVAGAEFCLIAEIIHGFRRMRVLIGANAPVTDCRPFQEGSKRFFLGEAAVALVVTGEDATIERRATYLGGAATHDAFHLVAPEPDGTELERCYVDALAAAGAKPDDVAVIKAHGSGTPINDAVEQAVADRLFPAETRLCTYKPLVGHCMAAAALVELAALLTGYEIGRLPGPVTSDPAHPRLADGGPPRAGLALCGSVGLGGANTVAVLDIPRGDLA